MHWKKDGIASAANITILAFMSPLIGTNIYSTLAINAAQSIAFKEAW